MKLTVCLAAVLGIACVTTAYAQKQKKVVSNQNITKGQHQIQGGDGVFGAIYTLNSGWNMAVLKARYSVDPFNSYQSVMAGRDEKLLIVSLAIKNSLSSDLYFGGIEWQAVDETGHIYPKADYRLSSNGNKNSSINLKPGQGVGQFPDQDEFAVAFVVPENARIAKLILKNGRKFVKGEEVVRYFISNVATKERDGQIGNPKNAIAPLPEYLRDSADKQGAVAATVPVVKEGFSAPSGYYGVSIDSVTLSSTDVCKQRGPSADKQFAIVTMTVKNIWAKEIGLFDLLSDETTILKDADGEKYLPLDGSGRRKAKRDEAVGSELRIAPGETATFRHFFEVPQDVKLKSISFGQGTGRKYMVDLTAAN